MTLMMTGRDAEERALAADAPESRTEAVVAALLTGRRPHRLVSAPASDSSAAAHVQVTAEFAGSTFNDKCPK